jgi:16S rRNA (guanine966-N2)-methyltransferase
LRIVGGRLRGRVLKAPESRAIRPTSDRLRESIFDILIHAYGDPIAGARVIDLFAGSGALGLEALSRGAVFALFVDDGAEARALLRANIEALALGGATRVFRRDATKLGDAPARHSLAFLDPPYGKGLASPALAALVEGGWLAPGAVVVVEEEARAGIAAPDALRLVEERAYGDTKITMLIYEPNDRAE